jgi:DNA transformation protein
VSPDDIQDMFCEFGPVSVRRMFGGAGIYSDGIMFGLVADDVIYLKADATTVPDYEREGLPPFTYTTGKDRRTEMSYRRMPDRLYDDPEELVHWAQNALAAAKRSAAQGRRDTKIKRREKTRRK